MSSPRYPLLVDLSGKACLVVGGGRVAVRKVRGLVDAGAKVTVVSPEIDDDIGALPGVQVERRHYVRGEAANYRFVVAATDDEAVNALVATDADDAAIFVNRVDVADGGSASLPAVHRHGPVTITVSTGGGSPRLSQLLRDRLADVVSSEHAALVEHLAFNREGGRADRDWSAADFDRELRDLRPDGDDARVYLVGAGPGDPGLCTLRGAEVLGFCDVVIYDRLAAPELLDLAPKPAERISVGKARDRAPLGQDEINTLLVARALAGERVVRLKGGDPFVFGRGGEETRALDEAGIAYEVVPGISSSIAAASSVGIPVTDREHAHSLTIVTGHEDPDGPTGVAWENIAKVGGTIVIMMGTRMFAGIARRLVGGGLDPATPAAAIRWATTPEEEVVRGSVTDLATLDLAAPSTIVIGHVASLGTDN